MDWKYTMTESETQTGDCLWHRSGFTYTLTKNEIQDCKHLFRTFICEGYVMELTLPGVGSESFSNGDQLEDWLRDDDDNPCAEYKVLFLGKEPACL